jgi:hypothetical protein
MAAAFYADDGLLASYDGQKLQGSLDVIAKLFARVRLKINAGKTKVLMSVGGKIYGSLSTEAYTRMKTPEGLTYDERMLAEKVLCPICFKDMSRKYRPKHLQQFHEGEYDELEAQWIATKATTAAVAEAAAEAAAEETNYTVDIPYRDIAVPCPVPSCEQSATTGNLMRQHFCFKHSPSDVVIITLNEGWYPSCGECDMQVPNVVKH